MMKTIFLILPFLMLILVSAGCGDREKEESNRGQGIKTLVCTTGMIADAVANIVGDKAEVISLMGPGVDPHLYKATQGDLERLSNADIIFYNGLHLEGKMGEILERLGRLKKVIAVSDGLDPSRLINSSNFAGAHDPHIWFDVSLWNETIPYITRILGESDPANAAFYQQNAQAYSARLVQVHEWVRQKISEIPSGQRVLITAHDAFEYFGKAYGIEVRGLQGISTVSEYGLKDISDLVNFITGRGIKAIFVESSVPRKSLEAVVEGCNSRGNKVVIGGTLFSDAMGQTGAPEGTYTGMVEANVNTIVNALK